MGSFVLTDILFLLGVVLILVSGIALYTRATDDEPDPRYQHFGPPTKESQSINPAVSAVFEPTDPARRRRRFVERLQPRRPSRPKASAPMALT